MSGTIKAVLWDIDGTLLDFAKSERCAVRKCFSIFELGECTDEMLEMYSKINKKYWKRLEKGEITRRQALIGRFEEFFEKNGLPLNIISDFNNEYQYRLGDFAYFCGRGKYVVSCLKGKVKQYAVTNGTLIAQEKKLKKSGLDKLLDGVFISETVGIEKPDKRFFNAVFEEIGHYESDEIMIIGDSLSSDMAGGNNAGILCCWYNRDGAENTEGVKIDYEIKSLMAVLDIVLKNENN